MSRLALISLAGLALSGCPQQPRPKQDPNVVARVNGQAISRAEFEAELSRESQAMEGGAARTREQTEPYKRTTLEAFVRRLVLLQAALDAGVEVSPDEVDSRMMALTSEYPANTLDAALAESRLSRDELERRTRDQLTIEKLLHQEVYQRVAVTEAELRQYHQAHPEEFKQPEAVHALQIVVGGLDDARRMQQLLWQGKKFQDVARKYSLSPDAKVGGDLGFFERGVMPPAFDEVVFRLAVGQTSDVVSTDYGFHLFKVVEKRAARQAEFAEVREAIERKLQAARREERQAAYLERLSQAADVTINEAILQVAEGRPAPALAPPGEGR